MNFFFDYIFFSMHSSGWFSAERKLAGVMYVFTSSVETDFRYFTKICFVSLVSHKILVTGMCGCHCL